MSVDQPAVHKIKASFTIKKKTHISDKCSCFLMWSWPSIFYSWVTHRNVGVQWTVRAWKSDHFADLWNPSRIFFLNINYMLYSQAESSNNVNALISALLLLGKSVISKLEWNLRLLTQMHNKHFENDPQKYCNWINIFLSYWNVIWKDLTS